MYLRAEKKQKAVVKKPAGGFSDSAGAENYAAIDLGTNSCRLVIATPTPSSFRIVETFSKITRLGEGIINNNELSHTAIRRTINALKVCAGVLEEYAPIVKARYVATAACRRAKNCRYFLDLVKKETGLTIETISSQEESRLAVVGCIPLLNRHIKRALVFDIGGGSTEVSLARMSNSGRTVTEGYVSLPYGVVTVSEAFPDHEMTDLAYNTIIERTHKILAEFEEKYHISEAIANQEIQVLGTSGTVTVLGAVHLNLPRYNRSAVDGLALSAQDVERTIAKIKRMGDEGRRKHACIGMQKADLTIAGCAIIEGLLSFWPISEITIADRGIREGILLDMMHADRKQRKNKKRFRPRYPFVKKSKRYFNGNQKMKDAVNDA
ncbi:MAG: Ppx/GppA phosphatase family protein [bacterium]|nr:Ppx/GppA phosphatase family protein [bacterium]MDY2830329.1 Ppx/GppA phosphatase family protein [Alphaproteobacteria bacterium]